MTTESNIIFGKDLPELVVDYQGAVRRLPKRNHPDFEHDSVIEHLALLREALESVIPAEMNKQNQDRRRIPLEPKDWQILEQGSFRRANDLTSVVRATNDQLEIIGNLLDGADEYQAISITPQPLEEHIRLICLRTDNDWDFCIVNTEEYKILIGLQ